MRPTGRRALLIGINHYAQLGAAWQLRGALNDVREMARFLVDDLDFEERALRVLLDSEATRANVLTALDRLVDETAEDDLVVVHFSGHGSWMRTSEGRAGENREVTLVPSDSGRGGAPNRDITSLELRARFLRLTEKTLRLTVIFDCCHSGTLSRDPFAARARWIPPGEDVLPDRSAAEAASRAALPYDHRYTLVAACRRNESAYEIRLLGDDRIDHGVLTHSLLTELRVPGASTTWRGIMEAVAITVNRHFPSQNPELAGSVDREVFGDAGLRPMRYLRVIETDEARRRVVVDGGAVHGVGRGSRWAAYPPGTRQIGEESRRLADIEICALRATTADGELVAPAAGCPPVGARLVETALGEVAAPFRVSARALPGGDRWLRHLAEEVRDHPLLEWCEENEGADARVQFLGPCDSVQDRDPLPDLGPNGVPVYAVAGPDGDLLMPKRELNGPEAIVQLVQNLVGRARWLHALELRQRDDLTLAGTVRFDVLRRRGGAWQPVSPADSVFEDGEPFAIEIQNLHHQRLFIYVLSFSVDGQIGAVYPVGSWAPVESGLSVRYGQADGAGVSFALSSSFPYTDPGAPAEASEVLKLFALVEATDFRPLFQDRYRHVRGWRSLYLQSLLGQRLCQLLIGDRDVRRVPGGVQQPWTTLERRVTIRRRGRKVVDDGR